MMKSWSEIGRAPGRALCAALLFWAGQTGLAAAEDTTLTLDDGAAFRVEDDQGEPRLTVDGDSGTVTGQQIRMNPTPEDDTTFVWRPHIMSGARGSGDHHLAFWREHDKKVLWFATGAGGILTKQSLVIDGTFLAYADPADGSIQVQQWGFLIDPENEPNALSTMLQIGPDVEFGQIIEVNNIAFPDGGALLVVDKETDFRFEIDNSGRLRFGPDGEPNRAALDVVLERVEDGANDHLRLTTEGGDTIDFKRQANVADPAGGATVDAECRAAVSAILDLLEGNGLMAP